jgi:hypothetical protein
LKVREWITIFSLLGLMKNEKIMCRINFQGKLFY